MLTPHRWRRLGALVALLLFLGGSPAAAHTDLVESTPAANATLDDPPEQVVLRFGEDLLPAGSQIVARQRGGARIELGQARVDGSRVLATWPAEAASGAYVIAYRVVAADGHPIEGEIPFSIRAGSTPSAGTPAGGSASTSAPSPSATAGSDAEGGGSSSGSSGFIMVFVVLATLGLGAWMVWRSRVR